MKVTYLHQYFNTIDMAGGTRSYEMARRLVAMGHEVNMVTSWRETDGRKGWFVTEEAGIKVHWLPVPYSNRMGFGDRIRAFFHFALRSAQRAAALDADIVFATSTPLTIALPAVYAARRRKVPMVFEVRDLWPQVPIALNVLRNPLMQWAASKMEKWAYDNSSAVVALAPGMKQGVVYRGFPTNRVAVIPNGADNSFADYDCTNISEELRSQYRWLGSGPLLVYAGAFGFVNDLEFMVDLAKEMAEINPGIRFVAIGDGARWEEIRDKANTNSVLNKNFFLLGKLAKKDVFKWLTIADAHLVLYKGPKIVWEDCVSNKLFDAMAVGKPIISNISGWGPLIAQAKGAGFVFKNTNTNQNAIFLNEMITDADWIRQAEDASRRLASEVFSRDMLAQRLEQVLVTVYEGKPELASAIAPSNYN